MFDINKIDRFLLAITAFLAAGVLYALIGIQSRPVAPRQDLSNQEIMSRSDMPTLTRRLDAAEERIEHQGWLAEALEPMRAWADAQPQFQIVDANGDAVNQDNAKQNVRLWLLEDLANGSRLPQIAQLTGDCTSWGAANAIHATQAAQIAAGTPASFQRIFPPWIYGAGRVWVWKTRVVGPLPAEGCSGAAVAQAAKDFGVLTWADAEAAGFKYSGQLADDWGRNGPPASLKEIAAKHKVKTVANVQSIEQVRDAICNGYGVTEASLWGNPKKIYHTQDGRIVGKRSGVWGHQMCIDGYDGSVPGKVYFHIQNSWYPESHPSPIDGSPVCGFWVESDEIEYMLAAGDCWAYSDFEGFPARDLQLFSQKKELRNAMPGDVLTVVPVLRETVRDRILRDGERTARSLAF